MTFERDNPYAQWNLGDYGVEHIANPIEQSVGPSRIVRGNPYETWMQPRNAGPGFFPQGRPGVLLPQSASPALQGLGVLPAIGFVIDALNDFWYAVMLAGAIVMGFAAVKITSRENIIKR